LEVAQELADGSVEFADFLAELQALGWEVVLVEAELDFVLRDVMLDHGRGSAPGLNGSNVIGHVHGHEKVLAGGQVVVLGGGQVKVLIPRSSCRPGG